MNARNNVKKEIRFMVISLIIILAIDIGFAVYVYSFNHTKRQYSSESTSNDLTLAVAPRTDQTDS